MKINNTNYDFSEIKMPTLERAKELTSKFIHPTNGSVLLIVPVAPDKTAKGIQVGDKVTKEVQKRIDGEGFMVVKMCPSLGTNIQLTGVKEGCFVFLKPEVSPIGKLKKVDKETGIEYIAVLAESYGIAAVITEPEYNLND
jgi:hypothetical protein